MRRTGKGWTKAGTYQTRRQATSRAKELRPKFEHVRVEKGTHGAAWGKRKPCHRVWVK